LNDASLRLNWQTSQALGFGFRCGFLGLLHMEIIQERLEREFNHTVITTVPNVVLLPTLPGRKGDSTTSYRDAHPQSKPTDEEPFINAQIITKPDYIGISDLVFGSNGAYFLTQSTSLNPCELIFEMPFTESCLTSMKLHHKPAVMRLSIIIL
jgi:GTP-binding protein LepA